MRLRLQLTTVEEMEVDITDEAAVAAICTLAQSKFFAAVEERKLMQGAITKQTGFDFGEYGCPTNQKVITNVTRVFDGATVWEP